VYLAVDSHHRRHLLVQVPDDTAPLTKRETRSLEVTIARFQVGSNPESLYVDLICTDSAQHVTFSAITQDLIRSLRHASSPPRDSIVSALARWRAFWMVKTGGMSREEALGLFGELWFMRRWLGAVNDAAVRRWQATDSARHDFQWLSASVEVKTAATQVAGPPVHRIGSLEQLADPEHGLLYLFSLQVCKDALAGNSLHSVVASLTAELQNDFQALSEFTDKLAARGYSPADQGTPSRPLRILAERLYRIAEGFPRLTRQSFQPGGLPPAIRSLEYEIDLAVCNHWLIATEPNTTAELLR
jgi:hypothetical protein